MEKCLLRTRILLFLIYQFVLFLYCFSISLFKLAKNNFLKYYFLVQSVFHLDFPISKDKVMGVFNKKNAVFELKKHYFRIIPITKPSIRVPLLLVISLPSMSQLNVYCLDFVYSVFRIGNRANRTRNTPLNPRKHVTIFLYKRYVLSGK